MTAELTVRLVGGPTALIELGGVRLLTDPTFDPPGDHPIGTRVLTNTTGPAVAAEELGRIDAVLFSHDQHPDNLDEAGRALLAGVPLVLTTELAAQRLGGAARELPSWESRPSTTGARRKGGRMSDRVCGFAPQRYSRSISDPYRSTTILRRSFRLGVSSPSSTVRSRSRMVNRLIVSHRLRPLLSSST